MFLNFAPIFFGNFSDLFKSVNSDTPSLSVQSWVGWAFEECDLVRGVPTHGQGFGARRSLSSLPNHSMICP